MMFDLRQLRHVLALDHYRSFARAAEAIGLTQPALSRSLQALEKDIGARLFDRDRARVEPTAVGLRLIELARLLVSQAKLAERELQQMIGLTGGLLRIGAGPFAAETSVGTAVGRLARRHPGIQVDVSVNDWPDLYRRLLNDELDVVIAETSHAIDDKRLIVEPLPQHPAVFYCRSGHRLSNQEKVTLEDIRRFPIAMTVLPKRLMDMIGKVDSTMRTDIPEGAATTEFRVEAPSMARSIVMESDVLGMALPHQIEHEVALGRIVMLRLNVALPWLTSYYGIVRLARRTASPAANEFLRLLREVEGEIDAGPRVVATVADPPA
jgi:DNA-binding transcriptional LysR family regulator